MDIRVDAHELQDLRELWAKAPEVMREELLDAVTEGTLLLEREIKENTPTGAGAGGGLRGSFTSEEQVLADNVIGIVGTPLAYAWAVEVGTKPHMPPVEPIEDWVKVKLDVAPEEVRNVAWAIARKIATVGTHGAHFVEQTLIDNESQIDRILGEGIERVVERLA